jgi:hypothetical protein
MSLNAQVEGGALGVEKLNSADADSETPKRLPPQRMYYIGLDVHKWQPERQCYNRGF